MRRLITRAAAVAACAAAALPVVASPAWAPKYILGSLAYGDCVARDEVSRFEGTLTVTSFSRKEDVLLVTGVVSGACVTDAGIAVASLPEGVVTLPVGSVDAFCTGTDVGVMIRPGPSLSAIGTKDGEAPFAIDLSRGTVVEASWTPGDPPSLRGQLCALDRIAGHRPLAALAPVLNAFVRV